MHIWAPLTVRACLVNRIYKGQQIVTDSSNEAEYVALSDGSKETVL